MQGSNIYRSQYQQEPLPHGYGFNPHQNEQYYQSQQPANSVKNPVYQPQVPEDQNYSSQPYKVHPIVTQSPQITQEPAPKKVSYLIDWIVCFLPLVFLLVILVLMVCLQTLKTRHINPEAAHATLEKLQFNLKAPPIIDIINVPAASTSNHGSFKEHLLNLEAVPTCPTGYAFASLGNWDGVHSGCICDNGEVKSKTYCTLHFASDKCKSVKSVDKKPIGIWKQKKYCVKHSEDWKWVAGVACPSDKKNCGGNICIPTEHLCPLTALEENTQGDLIIGGKKYKKKSTDGLPLVDIEVVPGIEKADCFDSNLSPLFQSEKYYPLSRKPAKGCDKYKDLEDYTTDLDNEKVKTVLHQNDLDDTINGIPFYSSYITENDHYTLQVIERIEIKNIKECGTVHPEQVYQITEKSQRVFNFETNISIIVLILCAIVLILAPILYVMRKKVFTQLDMTEHHQPKFYMFVAILVVILCLVLGFIYLTDVDGTDGLKDGNKKFGDYLKHECFVDDGLKLAVKEVDQFALNSYSTTYTWIITAFYVSIAFAVLMVILVIYQYSVHGDMFANPWKDRLIDQFRYQTYK